MDYRTFLEEALHEASHTARSFFGNVSGTVKAHDPNQVLTEADVAIGRLLIQKVRTTFPQHNIIDEEAGVIDNNSEYTWVIDPIDGTSNFASGVPTYGIMIGLLKNTTPLVGGFALPATNEVCLAEKGKGTYCNGKKLQVTQEELLQNCLVAYHIDGHPEDPARTQKETALLGAIILHIRNMRTAGCEPYDALLVAQGSYGALLNQTCKIWDVVAPHIILEEAGGAFTDFYGQEVLYKDVLKDSNRNYTLCAASPVLHKQLQTIIHHQ